MDTLEKVLNRLQLNESPNTQFPTELLTVETTGKLFNALVLALDGKYLAARESSILILKVLFNILTKYKIPLIMKQKLLEGLQEHLNRDSSNEKLNQIYHLAMLLPAEKK